jgi:uncharacterized protein
MINTVSYFEIQSDNPSKSVDFYTQIFGWTFTKDENLPIEYWRIKTDGMNGGLLQRPVDAPSLEMGTNAFVCSVQVDNFDETGKKIVETGGKVALEKFAVPGVCWQGYFIDLDNNTFGIFEVDEDAK